MNDILAIARSIHSERYPDASVLFLAGSLVRGEGTPFSDLDLVVVFPKLPAAFRESYRFGGYPVEAFVHDPETLEYFFVEMDRPSGIPSLPRMVVEGIEIPGPNDLSRALKERAASILDMGPPSLDSEREQRLRYSITDILDDLRGVQSKDERMAIGSELFEALANYYFRSRGLWSARGKTIPRALCRADPLLCDRYCRAFESLFTTGDFNPVIELSEELLRPCGGPLFEGYKSFAPPDWRSRSQPE